MRHIFSLILLSAPLLASTAHAQAGQAASTGGSAAALNAHIAATSAHGVAGNVVGTTDAQTLTNKTISSPSVTGTVLPTTDLSVALGSASKRFSYIFAQSINANGSTPTRLDIFTPTTSYYGQPSDGDGQTAHRFKCWNTLTNVNARIAEFMAGVSGSPVLSVMASGKLLQATTDTSATPGAATANTPTGKASIAAGASSVTITNTAVLSTSLIRAWIQQATADGTLTQVVRTSASAGSLTIYGNANATAATVVGWEVLN